MANKKRPRPLSNGKKNRRIRPTRPLFLEPLESRVVPAALLSGFVYLDSDNDAVKDATESGLPGAVVRLSGTETGGTAVSRSTLSDDTGAYSFGTLNPGTYQLSEQQPSAVTDGTDATTVPNASAGNDVISNIVLAADQNFGNNNFGERVLKSQFIGINWFFASSTSTESLLRETVAIAEQLSGNPALAQAIRAEGGANVPDNAINHAPVADAQSVSTTQNTNRTITLTGNDGDPTLTQALTFRVQTLPTKGTLKTSAGANVTVGTALPTADVVYTPNTGVTGSDSFTFDVKDSGGTLNGGQDTSAPATITISVTAATNQPFGPVTPGPFDASNLLGTRTDLVTGAPAITQTHVSTAVDYSAFSNPPTYGPHHGPIQDSTGNSITPRPTGVYTTEQPDEDLVHNLEHGHVWISYDPTLISTSDKAALEQLVTAGGTNTGVILTPRAANDSAIALASWAHLLKLNSFDATTIRNFIETNRGHAPEGFIQTGQKGTTAASETLDDGLLHTSKPIAPFAAVVTGSSTDAGLLGTRTDLVTGAPAVAQTHVTTAVDYTGFSNPPAYGPHHGTQMDSQNNFITPRPTGVYTTAQPDEDLVHNLEHGHVWISYNPTLISATDKTALEQFITAGGTNNGVILTPRPKNTSAIVLTSWTRQLTLSTFNATTIRSFIETNRGHAPEGFIVSGQKPANGDSLTDGLPHSS